jgi:phenylalanyl-tRNA synthetase beta chain
MLISCNWLQRHVDLAGVDLDALADRFTLSVAELEEVHHVGAGLAGVVVGRVLEVHPIEGATVQRTLVDVGAGAPRQIVCGAPNVAAGQLVAVALPGTRLGDLEIGEASIRGVASAGMIASERELGIGDGHEGILVLTDALTPGTRLSDAYPVVDTLFEIDNKSLTHRPDCWGHRGIAREIAALLGRPLAPLVAAVPFTEARPLVIRVDDPAACPRYSAVTLDGVTVAPSPMWLRILLHRVGTRPISNVVDATNFVMLDLGNPLHAFDRRELGGDAIVVRRAAAGETFVTLDGVARPLLPGDLLIADAQRGVALAGVMGGENSEIRADTTSVVLESANFDAAVIRMTSQRLGLRTESSARFEKSLDPRLAEDASRAFCRLLLELDPHARVTSAFMDVAAPLPEPPVIALRVDLVARRLGVNLGAERVTEILTGLTFGVTPDAADADVLQVQIPSFRATKDITLEIDLIEEIGRIYGYDNIPPAGAAVRLSRPHPNRRKRFERAARAHLTAAAGFDEVKTYAFDTDPHLERIGAVPARRATLANPISAEMPALRTALGPNLLLVAEKNDREHDAIHVFELGRVFIPVSASEGGDGAPNPGPLPHQPTTLGALSAAPVATGDPEAALFFGLKGVLMGLARACARPLTVAQGGVARPWAHPVRQARLLAAGEVVGYLAEVHPVTLKQLKLRKGAALFELDLDAWRAAPVDDVTYRPLPRFPSVFRDFAVVVPEAVSAGAVREAIAAATPDLQTDVAFQSVYRGKGLAEGAKSLAYAVTWRLADRTLGEAEVKALEEAVWRAVAAQVGGRPRA